MRRSRVVVPIHFVWATKDRFEWITPEWEPRVYATIRAEAEKMGSEVLAIGGMPDHVHLVVLFGASFSISQFVKQIKGATSRLTHDVLIEEKPFYWQEGYGAFAFHNAMAPKVIRYVENQKKHHAAGKTWLSLEETTIEVQ